LAQEIAGHELAATLFALRLRDVIFAERTRLLNELRLPNELD
jgi:hypothetical protein